MTKAMSETAIEAAAILHANAIERIERLEVRVWALFGMAVLNWLVSAALVFAALRALGE